MLFSLFFRIFSLSILLHLNLQRLTCSFISEWRIFTLLHNFLTTFHVKYFKYVSHYYWITIATTKLHINSVVEYRGTLNYNQSTKKKTDVIQSLPFQMAPLYHSWFISIQSNTVYSIQKSNSLKFFELLSLNDRRNCYDNVKTNGIIFIT